METEIAYTTVPGKIPAFMARLREVGIPSRATNAWLQSIGMTSTNDRSLLNVLRQAKLLSSESVPTELWVQYRAGNGQALAKGLQEGYAAFFSTYPDADRRTPAELENVVKAASPKLGKDAVNRAVSSFRALVALADFSAVPIEASYRDVTPKALPSLNDYPLAQTEGESAGLRPSVVASSRPTISLNLTINLPENASPESYRAIFSAMRVLIENDGKDDSLQPAVSNLT